MENQSIEITLYKENYKQAILDIWERSVLATHHFVTDKDFAEIKLLVSSIDFNSLQVYCAKQSESILGFIGVADRKIEMLSLDPEYFGQGAGKKLLNFAIKELNANKVDVNEQNEKAIDFYQRNGFVTYEKTARDAQGKNYPLLRMMLTNHK